MDRYKVFILMYLVAGFLSCGDREKAFTDDRRASHPITTDEALLSLGRYCDSLAETSNAGIALVDLRSRRLLVLAGREYIVEETFMPASTFKLITAITSLTSGISVPPGFQCTGEVHASGNRIRCWKNEGHGPQNLAQALQNSCNTYFAVLGELCNVEQLRKTGELLGYGSRTRFAVNGESSGVMRMPVPDDERIVYALGHSEYCRITGLQLLQMVSILATRGEFIGNPRLFDWERLDPIYMGMEQAVLYGTAAASLVHDYPAAGKTGTLAANVDWRTRGWFCGYAPYDAPEVAIVVFTADGTGSTTAAPVAGKVLATLLELKGR